MMMRMKCERNKMPLILIFLKWFEFFFNFRFLKFFFFFSPFFIKFDWFFFSFVYFFCSYSFFLPVFIYIVN